MRAFRAMVLRNCTALMALTVVAATGISLQGCSCILMQPAEPLVASATASASSVPIGDSVLLAGSASGGRTPYASFEWLQQSGPTATFVPTSGLGEHVAITANSGGVAVIQLTVQDGVGERAVTTVSVTFMSLTPPLAAFATATPSSVVLAGGDSLTLVAYAAGGTPGYTYFWVQTSGLPATIADVAAQNTVVTLTWAGTYTFTVTVTDSTGRSITSDRVTITAAYADASSDGGS